MEANQPKHTNRLANETSPYLLQHAHNPVNWYPWGEEALSKARTENKPILVSIGYAACHWCHVMERESFEDEEVAAYMNEHFVNIKIDREERPDIDHIYMDAVQAMTGSGGWPLNAFLTPGLKPFYGGTYFPPVPAHGRPTWMQVLAGVSRAFTEKRDDIEKQGDSLTSHIASQEFFTRNIGANNSMNNDLPNEAFKNLQRNFDAEEGGFGGAPKFPGTFNINFLLRHHHYTKNEEALTHALLSLDKMCMGGIYDQLGGGFARYSTDAYWLAPHFEKMLYDNALLVSTLCDAYKVTGKPLYADTIRQTLEFVKRELTHEHGGFYASLDADSEGVEGKFYCWDKKDIDTLLKEDAALFCEYYDVTEEGNWEHQNILHQTLHLEDFAKQKNISADAVAKTLAKCREILWQEREKRIRPALDDKIILSWNTMMCSAYVAAYKALGEPAYLKIAENNMAFLLKSFSKTDGSFYHNYKNNKGFNFALLDDYALLIQALLDLQEGNFNTTLIQKANEITAYVQQHFFDEADGLFFYTSGLQTDLLLRKKEFFDSATPSGNSVMASNLKRLGILLDNKNHQQIAAKMLQSFTKLVAEYPSSFGNWLSTITDTLAGEKEIAIVGKNYLSLAAKANRLFIPGSIMMAAEKEDAAYPLLAGKEKPGATLLYLCENYACRQPVETMEEFKKMLTIN